MSTPSLALIPSGYIADKVYSVLPANGDGDFNFDRDCEATRINKDGLIETVSNNVPRLDYTDSECPVLLLEPQRTNLITTSETYTTVSKIGATVSDNFDIVDLYGNTNAKTLTATSTNQPRLEWRNTSVPVTDTIYTMSLFVRKKTARFVSIAHFSQGGEYTVFDIENGTINKEGGTASGKIESYNNGWFRISKSFNVPSSVTFNYWKFLLCTDNNAFVGVIGEDVDIFGLQLEIGSYPTSYIPTTGSAVTRFKDECINGGNSSIFSNTTGTVFVDFEAFTPINNFGRLLSLSDQTSNNTLILIPFITNQFRFLIQTNDGSIDVDTYQSVLYNTRQKIAISYELNSVKIYINGTLVFTDTSVGTFSNLTKISFADVDNNPTATAKIYELIYFDSVISQTEAETLTTL